MEETSVLDLRNCEEGMRCEEFSLLTIAGPNRKDLPPTVRERMEQHENACSYHQSATWHNSAISTPITKTMEEGAMEIIRKYS